MTDESDAKSNGAPYWWLECHDAGNDMLVTFAVGDIVWFSPAAEVIRNQVPRARSVLMLRNIGAPFAVTETYAMLRERIGLAVSNEARAQSSGLTTHVDPAQLRTIAQNRSERRHPA